MFQQYLAIFHKSRPSAGVVPLPVWFLHPWLSATNGFYRNYQELGEQNGGAENNFGALAPPGAATELNLLKPVILT